MTTDKIIFKTTTIKASSRASIKVGDSYYTFEATEERSVDNSKLPSNLDEAEELVNNERRALWDTVNGQVDSQIEETLEFLKKRR